MLVIMKMGRGHGAPPVSHGHMDYDTLEQSSGLHDQSNSRNDIISKIVTYLHMDSLLTRIATRIFAASSATPSPWHHAIEFVHLFALGVGSWGLLLEKELESVGPGGFPK